MKLCWRFYVESFIFNVFSVERSVVYWFKMFAAIVQNITNSSEPPHDRRLPLFFAHNNNNTFRFMHEYLTQPNTQTRHTNKGECVLDLSHYFIVASSETGETGIYTIVWRAENLPPNISFIIICLIFLTLHTPNIWGSDKMMNFFRIKVWVTQLRVKRIKVSLKDNFSKRLRICFNIKINSTWGPKNYMRFARGNYALHFNYLLVIRKSCIFSKTLDVSQNRKTKQIPTKFEKLHLDEFFSVCKLPKKRP